MNELVRVTSSMAWSEPILPVHVDREWEAQVKETTGELPDLMRRVASSKWLREAVFKWPRIPPETIPWHLVEIAGLITAQENACRYCYGVARVYMKVFGRSDKEINRIEREMQVAELDETQRVVIRFCRNLARSSPRPPKAEREKLISLGFTPEQVAELAFHVCAHCFINRVATFVSSVAMQRLERVSYSFLGRVLRKVIANKIRGMQTTDFKPLPQSPGPFPGVVRALGDSACAAALNEAIEGANESNVLSSELKALMFAVVAKTLQCDFCQTESRSMAANLGIENDEFERALANLSSPRLSPDEIRILNWTRETIHYDTSDIQKKVRALAEDIPTEVMVEAIGMAALANTVVRLAILLE